MHLPLARRRDLRQAPNTMISDTQRESKAAKDLPSHTVSFAVVEKVIGARERRGISIDADVV